MATGVHILESTMQVDFVEGSGRTIVAQIHGKESDTKVVDTLKYKYKDVDPRCLPVF